MLYPAMYLNTPYDVTRAARPSLESAQDSTTQTFCRLLAQITHKLLPQTTTAAVVFYFKKSF